ncbi:hypothetical protein ASE01_16090 [Nocardioides sp. Root190]|uniref:DUF4184 family protein n=1 Tax=Nocardioides sp. Root190 TaxID=1736488 RepID=UPI0006F48BB8|nr:DUF4184 family protein [Nocardioides sp. Root190]KRB76474.1 hypothetical protein ASE01_16090 [Nocardioides sp. Root190]
MPVTIAHPAAVLPLRGLGLPLSAMVIGSMAPDLPVFSQSWGIYGFTHSVLGILTVDLAIALVLLAFWDLWGRDALVDTSPSAFRDRLPGRARIGRQAWILAPLAAVVGSITHVVWDAFTHSGRWGVRLIPWLQEEHGSLRGEQWAQYASGAIGVVVLGSAILVILRRPVLGPSRPRRLPVLTLPAAVGLASVCSVATFVGRILDEPFGLAAFHAAVVGIVSLGVVVLAVAVAWVARPVVSAP